MYKALVSSEEYKFDLEGEFIGYRICEVAEKEFDIHKSFFWIDCDDFIIADRYYYDPESEEITAMPQKDPLDGIVVDELEISPEDEADLLALLEEDDNSPDLLDENEDEDDPDHDDGLGQDQDTL